MNKRFLLKYFMFLNLRIKKSILSPLTLAIGSLVFKRNLCFYKSTYFLAKTPNSLVKETQETDKTICKPLRFHPISVLFGVMYKPPIFSGPSFSLSLLERLRERTCCPLVNICFFEVDS